MIRRIIVPVSNEMYKLVVNNFNCPDFHTCEVVESLDACKKLKDTVCQTVKTSFENLASGKKFPGPDQMMSIIYHQSAEEMSKYLHANAPTIAAVGLGVGITALGIYGLHKIMTAGSKSLQTTDRGALLKGLKKAEVTVGHWNGRHLNIEGLGVATFNQVSSCIEQLYLESVQFMRDRQESYDKTKRPKLSLVVSLLNAVVHALTPPPQVTKNEEQQVRDAMKWQSETSVELNRLFETSQNQLNQTGKLNRVWDRALDKISSWRALPNNDTEILEAMVKQRPSWW